MASTLEQAERGIAYPPAADLPVVKGIPVRAGPGVIGARVSHLQPPPVAVPATLLDMDEQTVLNYQMAVWCFAFLDMVSTVLNIVAVYASGLQWNPWQLLFLLLLVGPICGLIGAGHLNRSLVAVFVISCLVKAVIQVSYALYTFYLWTILFAFLQCWITKIAATFWWVLGNLTKERRRQVLEVKNYDVQRVYW